MKDRYKTALTVLIAAVWALWLSSAHLTHGPESYYRQHDTAEGNGAFFVGQSAYASRDLLGDWTPTAGAGVDARANGKGVQPLFEATYRFLPYWWTTGVIVAAQTFGAAFFTVVLLRRRLGVPFVAAMLAGLAYSMMYDGAGAHSGFFLPAGFLIPGFPLLLLGLMRAGESRAPAAIASAAAIAILLGLLAGPILTLLALPIIALWMFAVEPAPTKRHAAVFAMFTIGFAVMAAPMFGAMAAHAADAHRTLSPSVSAGEGTTIALWEARRVEALMWVRITLPLLAPAAIAWLLGGFRRRPLNALLGVSLGIIALEWLMVPVRGLLQQIAPAFATFQIDRVTQLLPFLTSAAGAVGLHHLLELSRNRRRSERLAGFTVFGAAAAAIGAVLIVRGLEINRGREELRRYPSTYSGMLQQKVLVDLAAKMRLEPPARIVTFADRNQEFSGQHPGFAWAQGLETADGYLNLYPVRYHTFWSWVIRPALELRPELQRYFDEWGNMFYLFNPYARIPYPIPASQIVNLRLLGLANVRYLVSAVAFDDPHLVPWRGNAGTATSEVQWTPTATGSNVRSLFVYENTLWLPRFFVASESRTFAKSDELLSALASASIEDLRRTAFLEAGATGIALAQPTERVAPEVQPDVTVATYSADVIELDVRAASPGILIITNNHSRFWRARVNDRPAQMARVDFTFQGVPVPAGTSRVRLEYVAPYAFAAWQCALAIAAIAAIFAALWVAAERRIAHVRAGVRLPSRRKGAFVAAGVILAGAIVVSARPRAAAPWAVAGSPYRVKLLVRPKSLSTPTDLPILVQRGPDDDAFWSAAQASGSAIRFVDGQGHPLPHEIEEYDAKRRRLSAWVQVPQFGWGDRLLYMYFGGAAAPDAERPADVWRGRYVAVWHMQAGAGGPAIRDSTAHGNHAQPSPGMMPGRLTVGRIGGAVAFDGAANRLTVADSDLWSFGRDDWTVEFWIYPSPLEKRNFGILEHGPGGLFHLYLHATNMFALERNHAGVHGDHSFAGIGVEPGVWSHVSLARTGPRLLLQINGELKEAFDGAAGFEESDPADALTIGWGSHGGVAGALDEVRISRGPRPPGWSRAIYLSQTGALVTVGAVEPRPSGS